MPTQPAIMRKTIATHIGRAATIGKFFYKLGVATDHVQFYHKTEMMGKLLGQETHSHTVDFTEAEKQHLLLGGTIVVVHGCGTELHVTLPKIV